MKKSLPTSSAPARRSLPRRPRTWLGGLALAACALLPTVLLAPRAKSAGGAVPVQIANTAPLPVSDVNGTARTPLTLVKQVVVPTGQYQASAVVYTVPAGMRLVIQNVNTDATVDTVSNGVHDVTIQATPNQTWFSFTYPMSQIGSYDWATNQATQVYADPGTPIKVGVDLFQKTANSPAYANIALTGYLESV